ncbi:MAG: WD40 repeat domain-containing protein [Spirochaetaceae bacterium]|jgi:hypothetical protein|nr:WD40 repeat domain-containing protein [Spirochaetaceae bacterium]
MTDKQKQWLVAGAGVFLAYIFIGAQPIPEETVLGHRWFKSLESNYPMPVDASAENQELLPFFLGSRTAGHFGYVDKEGNFTVNQSLKGNRNVYLSPSAWAEHDAIPGTIEVRNPLNQPAAVIPGGLGYPMFLDKRMFLVNSGLNSLSALNETGGIQWTYDFAAQITVIDGANGLILAGLLNGTVEVLNDQGKRIFAFEPGGSRISVIYGCAMAQNGSRFAVISGVDLQRFLLLERYSDAGDSAGGVEYKVIYHEFLEEGFRRPVHIEFVDNDERIAFERQGGLGLYEIRSRTSLKLPLAGEIKELDSIGNDRLLFLVTSQGKLEKRLVAIRFPGTIIIEAPFKSEYTFLGRQDSRIYIGGNMTLAAFELEKK